MKPVNLVIFLIRIFTFSVVLLNLFSLPAATVFAFLPPLRWSHLKTMTLSTRVIALSTRPVITNVSKRDRNSWHFYIIRTGVYEVQIVSGHLFSIRYYSDIFFPVSASFSEFRDDTYPLHSRHAVAVRGSFVRCRL